MEVAPEATSTGALTLLKAGPVTLQLNMITLLFCWSVTEVLRYGFYAAKVLLMLTAAPSSSGMLIVARVTYLLNVF